MTQIGEPMRRVIAHPEPKPARAPRPKREEPAQVPDWLNPNREPVKVGAKA